MKTLVLAEKPSVGRDIAKVLGCNKKINGALEGNKFVVTWALGHLVTLADPEKYDRKYQHWAMEDLPIIPILRKNEVIGMRKNISGFIFRPNGHHVLTKLKKD